jgi:mannan polymerase II complex ANP1 subunit
MEEMENERKAREAEEKAKQERLDKIQNDFDDGASQWAKDKEELKELQKDAEAKKAEEKKAEKSGEKADEKADKKSDDKASSDV